MALTDFTKLRILTIQETEGKILTDWQIGPILLQGNSPGLPGYINFSDFNLLGADFRVLDSDDTTPLNYYIGNWDDGTRTAEIWLKVSLGANASKEVFIYGRNPIAVDNSNYDAIMTKMAVEASTELLLHLDTGSGLSAIDSSVNGFNGNIETALSAATVLWDPADGGQQNGNNKLFAIGSQLLTGSSGTRVGFGNQSQLEPGNGDFSAVAWLNTTGTPFGGLNTIFDKSINGGGAGWSLAYLGTPSTFQGVTLIIGDGVLGGGLEVVSVNLPIGTKIHVVFTWDSTANVALIYINGVVIPFSGSPTWPTGNISNSKNFTMLELSDFALGSAPALNTAIDECAILSKKLEAFEVLAHYQRRKSTISQPTFQLSDVTVVGTPQITRDPNNFLGKGIKFPFGFSQVGSTIVTKSTAISEKVERINESLRQILGTKLGERVHLPEYGSRLNELLFLPITDSLVSLSQIFVIDAIKKWEKRIILKNVIIGTDQTLIDVGIYQILIDYTIIGDQVDGNLVYPFYTKDQI